MLVQRFADFRKHDMKSCGKHVDHSGGERGERREGRGERIEERG
jgi:hypothetical protein